MSSFNNNSLSPARAHEYKKMAFSKISISLRAFSKVLFSVIVFIVYVGLKVNTPKTFLFGDLWTGPLSGDKENESRLDRF